MLLFLLTLNPQPLTLNPHLHSRKNKRWTFISTATRTRQSARQRRNSMRPMEHSHSVRALLRSEAAVPCLVVSGPRHTLARPRVALRGCSSRGTLVDIMCGVPAAATGESVRVGLVADHLYWRGSFFYCIQNQNFGRNQSLCRIIHSIRTATHATKTYPRCIVTILGGICPEV